MDGSDVVISEVGRDYEVAGGALRMVGLADLGQPQDAGAQVFYDDCYAEDRAPRYPGRVRRFVAMSHRG